MNMEEKLSEEQGCGNYADLSEVKHAVHNLTDVDHQKLMIIAKSYWGKRKLQIRCSEPGELISEAILTTLREEGKRWRRGVSIVKHLDQAMRNISSQWAGKGVLDTEQKEVIVAFNGNSNFEQNPVADRFCAKNELSIVSDLFRNDKIGYEVVQCRAMGMKESEVCKTMGIGITEYQTACKRIRRTLLKFRTQEVQNAKK
jgi:hypothetical protein